jgi:hypothetical protein
MRNTLSLARRACLVLMAGLVLMAPAALEAASPNRGKLDPLLRQRAARPEGRTQVIVRLRSGANGSDVVRKASGKAGVRLALLNAQVAELSDEALDGLTSDPNVVSVHYDRPLVASVDGMSVRVATGLAGTGSRNEFDGSGVGVAIIDSGIAAHGDLSGAGIRRARRSCA